MTTIWADWGFLFILGLILGWATSRQVKSSGSLFFNRYYLLALAFQTVFCMPLLIYCYVVYPDWCWMYWLKADQVQMTWVILAFFGYYVTMTIGFGISAKAEQVRIDLGRRITDVSMGLFLVFMLIFHYRLFWVGSVEQFKAHSLPFLAMREPLFALLVCGIFPGNLRPALFSHSLSQRERVKACIIGQLAIAAFFRKIREHLRIILQPRKRSNS